MPEKLEIINKIEDIRKSNNSLWMQLLQIATESNPGKTKEILAGINKNDKKISEFLENLEKIL